MWNFIISDNQLRKKAIAKIDAIYKACKTHTTSDITLYSGWSGIILFNYYYSKFKSNPEFAQQSYCHLETIFDTASTVERFDLASGLSGIFYSVRHLHNEEFVEFDADSLDFDYNIFKYAMMNSNNMDFISGSAGIASFLLEVSDNNSVEELLNIWVETLEKKAEEHLTELKWKVPLQTNSGNYTEGYCLGLAHGTPHIIILLTKIHIKTKSKKAALLAEKALTFLMSVKHKERVKFYFPSSVVNHTPSPGKLAWCYGDLGCALAIYNYAIHFKRPELEIFANEIFLEHTSEENMSYYHVDDPDICHGSVGIAHIYARIFNLTGNEIYRKTAEHWYKVTLEKDTFEDGIAGYKHFKGETGYFNSYGLLEGISGIGLSLISAIDGIEPKWDSAFLLS